MRQASPAWVLASLEKERVMQRQPIKRALVSVFDKTGLVDLGRHLSQAGVEIISTGSTAAHLKEAGVAVTEVSELTGFPECLGGRVKTLHPAVHGGILAASDQQDQLAELGIKPFELVVVNLYPFAQTVAEGKDYASCVEMIDIGGPTMLRAGAKNHERVATVCSPTQYPALYEALEQGGTTRAQRQSFALEAFRHTAAYDITVASWLGSQIGEDQNWVGRSYRLKEQLRYGENPHQEAAVYQDEAPVPAPVTLATASLISGKPMSFNNYQDADAAIRAARDHTNPAVAIIKHANPCGVAVAASISAAYQKAFACDPLSAYGSVVAANRPIDADTAELIKDVFTEVVIAPYFTEEALDILTAKKNLRLLCVPMNQTTPQGLNEEITQIEGGIITQQIDRLDASGTKADGTAFGDDPAAWTLVAGANADGATLADLEFAWRTVRSVKSNAILLARDLATVGVGMGQVNRVDSARLAVERANTLGEGERSRGAVAASDAFFPFPDGLQILIDAGVEAVVAPGGSIRDAEVIEAAQKAGITLYFTGVRHFWH